VERTPETNWPLVVIAGPLLLLLIIPLVALLTRTAPATIWLSLGDPSTQAAIALSMRTSAITAVLVLAMGTPLAILLGRRHLRASTLIEILVDLPTVLPPAVAGVALLLAFGRRSLIGGGLNLLGIQIPFTAVAVVMAQTFVAAPYFIKTAASGLSAISPELEQAAALDGATPGATFLHVMLPLARRSIIGGVTLCWARALGEFGATIIFAGNLPGRTQTMPLAVYLGFEIDMDQALTLAAILLVISFVVLFVARAALRGSPED
jgi:molybdate transport system permease protein